MPGVRRALGGSFGEGGGGDDCYVCSGFLNAINLASGAHACL